MRHTSAKNGASDPRRHHETSLLGPKRFRRFHIVTHSARSGCRVGARHDFYIKPGMAFADFDMTTPSVIPGKRSTTRNPFPMRHTSAKNGASDPRRHHETLLFGPKGFRRFHIVTHSARSGCRVGARHDFYIKPGMAFADFDMTTLTSFRASAARPGIHFQCVPLQPKTAHQIPDDTTQPCYLARRGFADSIS